MPRKRTRRQSHGSAWHWKQTDGWYYTMPGTRKRVPLYDEEGRRLRGLESKEAAGVALARIKVAGQLEAPPEPVAPEQWLVARACSEYIQSCDRGVKSGACSSAYHVSVVAYLNDLCRYCGAMEVSQLKRGHIQNWLSSHAGWKSPATHRGVIAIVLAAFNYVDTNFGVTNPIKGFKKPRAQPRLDSLGAEDEQVLYDNTDRPFRDFLFAAIHTGLRPFCELAKVTADDVVETERGMMWRVFSSKTKKLRKIPVFPKVAVLTRKLMKDAPPGSGKPLLRNARGGQWRRVAGVVRFMLLRRKLGWDKDPVRKRYSCYTCRHTFAHRMLSGFWNRGQGCSIETLAELMGDTPKVVFDHYGREWGQYFQEPLWAAVGGRSRKQRKAG